MKQSWATLPHLCFCLQILDLKSCWFATFEFTASSTVLLREGHPTHLRHSTAGSTPFREGFTSEFAHKNTRIGQVWHWTETWKRHLGYDCHAEVILKHGQDVLHPNTCLQHTEACIIQCTGDAFQKTQFTDVVDIRHPNSAFSLPGVPKDMSSEKATPVLSQVTEPAAATSQIEYFQGNPENNFHFLWCRV